MKSKILVRMVVVCITLLQLCISVAAADETSFDHSTTGMGTLSDVPIARVTAKGPSDSDLMTETQDSGAVAPLAKPVMDADPPTEKTQNNFPVLSSAELFFSGDGDPNRILAGAQHQVPTSDETLRQFGYDFFRHGNFIPDQQALVGPDYIIGPGDSIRIDIWGNIEGIYYVTVDRKGEITLPKVGVINLWGQTFTQIQETIHRQIDKYFKNFEMNVTMGSLRSIQIFLVGEVEAPGTYQISSLSTLLTALSSAEGPNKSGSLRSIQLLRGGSIVRTIDLYDFFLHGNKSADIRLRSGDTIFVPVAGSMVGVAGSVRRPAIYELLKEETIQDVLELAGGLIPTAYLQKVQVRRVDAYQSRIVLDLDLQPNSASESALSVKVQDLDMVKVSPITMTGGYVTLEGYVARPGNYQLTPDMHLKDLILSYDNLLPEFYPDLVRIIRISSPEYRPEILTVNINRALQGDPKHNLKLQEYDTVRFFSRKEMEEQPEVSISGAVLKEGTYRLYDKMTVKDLLTTAGNLKRDAYLGEAELTRYIKSGKTTQTQRLVIDLSKVLSGGGQENIRLQPYDHLVVRTIPDLTEKPVVTIRGKVLLPGEYTISKGEKLSSLLKRAGGFAEGAHLPGAFFTRESVKKIQKKRIDELLFEQEQELARITSDIAIGALSPEEAESAQTVLASRQAAINKLRKVPVTGRMVIHLQPLEEFSDSRFDIEVMTGDVIIIPENPMSVSVLGQVYNPISLSCLKGEDVSYYLSLVGGSTENADTKNMFIVRANGTVYSKSQAGSSVQWSDDTHRWVVGGFSSTELRAGDTLLVPEKINKIDIMRELKDISTIIYQMALGAAVVASF